MIEVVLSFALGLKVTLLAYVRQSFLVFTQKSAETIIDTHTLRVLDWSHIVAWRLWWRLILVEIYQFLQLSSLKLFILFIFSLKQNFEGLPLFFIATMIKGLMAVDLILFIRAYLRRKCFDLSYLIGLSLYFFDHQLQHEILFLNKICIGLIEQLTFLAKGVKHKGMIFQCINCFADIILLLRLRFPKGKQVLFLGYHGSAFLFMRHRYIIDPI